MAAALRYEATVDLPNAAAEAGLTPDEFAARLRRSPALSRSLGALLAKGGTVQRQVFQDDFRGTGPRLPSRRRYRTTTVNATPDAVRRPRVVPCAAWRFRADGRPSHPAAKTRRFACGTRPPAKRKCAAKGTPTRCWASRCPTTATMSSPPAATASLRLWDAKTGKELRRFNGHTDAVFAVAFSPDGRQALSAGADQNAAPLGRGHGQGTACWPGHTAHVTSVAFSPDGKLASVRQ